MNTNIVRTLGPFLVGFIGWLAVSAMHLEGEVIYFAAFALGFIAGTVVRWPLGPIALLVGMAASYPVALATGMIAFLGGNWETYAVIFGLLAVAGSAVSDLVVRGPRRAEGAR